MGWFDEQIRQRKQSDNDVFSESFIHIASSVLGNRLTNSDKDDRRVALDAFSEILRFYHIKDAKIPEGIEDTDELLEYIMRPYGIMRRKVILSKGWYKDAYGPMLSKRTDNGKIVALIPTGLSGYSFYDSDSESWIKINKKNENIIDSDGVAFYKPFPLRKINIVDLGKYIAGIISMSDVVMIGIFTIIVTLVGMIMPKITSMLFSTVIESESNQVLIAIGVFMICVSIGTQMLQTVKGIIMARISTKLDVSVEAATMMRILSLPASFFKDYGPGELLSYSQYIGSLCEILVSTVLSTGLTSIFSLAYITQIFAYAPGLVVPALIIIFVTIMFSVISALVQMNLSKKMMKHDSKETGMSYALISGIQKIKLTGSEKRAFARWGELYAEGAKYRYNPPMFLKINPVISMAITLTGTIVMYYFAIQSKVSVADYMAFNAAYGMVSGAFSSLASIALQVANIKPIIDMAKPVMEAEPELADGKQMVTRLSGGVELNNISFRYNENMPNVLENLSLKIKPGQYVAIVGATGCGKSTLMRILLGFEKPQKGAVYYDGKDINQFDLKSLRQKIGVVMQNGKLFQGDIFSNIVISAPRLNLNAAWEAAEIAGMAEDIRNMPMGMNTLISEGSGGISGGQRQRLMIARAVAPKPKILMLDEATSALDNITQKHVSDSLEKLKCTRIVIAHRLSTIKHCDRIIVLDKGNIIEDGTYDELIEANGFFAELVERQRLDV